jgi:hypothetical protein
MANMKNIVKNASAACYGIAFAGISAAVAVVVMFLSLLPSFAYAVPALAGFVICCAAQQVGRRYALIAFVSASMLSAILIPEPEAVIFFIAFFGYYPTLRPQIQKLHKWFLRWGVKLLVFNIPAVMAFAASSYIIGMDVLLSGLGDFGQWTILILLVLANGAFLLYDMCIAQLTYAYVRFLKPKFGRSRVV